LKQIDRQAQQINKNTMAISAELLNDILEVVYIASLERNTIVVTDANDETESSGGNGKFSINAEERCDTNSNNGNKYNRKLSAIASASAFLAGLFTSKSDATLIHKSIDKTINDYDDYDDDDDDDDLQPLVVQKFDFYAIKCARAALRI
jgi:hypothetical protein